MDKAVSRIKDAISRREKILVYGDYDVDHMTGRSALSALPGRRHPHLYTNRLEEGYGLNMGAIKRAHASGISLIVTVDCGFPQ